METKDILIVSSLKNPLVKIIFEIWINFSIMKKHTRLIFFYSGNRLGILEEIVFQNDFRGVIFHKNVKGLSQIKNSLERFTGGMKKKFHPTYIKIGLKGINGDLIPAKNYEDSVTLILASAYKLTIY